MLQCCRYSTNTLVHKPPGNRMRVMSTKEKENSGWEVEECAQWDGSPIQLTLQPSPGLRRPTTDVDGRWNIIPSSCHQFANLVPMWTHWLCRVACTAIALHTLFLRWRFTNRLELVPFTWTHNLRIWILPTRVTVSFKFENLSWCKLDPIQKLTYSSAKGMTSLKTKRWCSWKGKTST